MRKQLKHAWQGGRITGRDEEFWYLLLLHVCCRMISSHCLLNFSNRSSAWQTLYICVFGRRWGIRDCSYTLQDCRLAAVSDVERGPLPPLHELIFESRGREVGKHAIMGLRYMFGKHLELKALWGFRSPPIPDYHIVRCLHASSRIFCAET